MQLKYSIVTSLLFVAGQFSFGQTNPKNANSLVWVADNGDGTYKNPIIHADYSDPDAIRVGDDYYMTSSSFNSDPGLPILHSKDMVNWELVNYALKKQPPFDVYDKPGHGNGVWAPCIRYHNNEFYIYYSVYDDELCEKHSFKLEEFEELDQLELIEFVNKYYEITFIYKFN